MAITELSRISGVPKRTLYNAFEPGHDFRISILDALSEHIYIDYQYVFTGIRSDKSLHSGAVSKSLHTYADSDTSRRLEISEPIASFMGEQLSVEEMEEFVFIPHYNVSAEAGSGRLLEDVQPRPFPFRRYWIKNNLGASPDNLILIRVTGDSMHPTLNSGDTVLIDQSKIQPVSDAIFLVRIDELYRIKRVQKLPGNQLRLTSDNQHYRDIEVDIDQDGFEIIGQIVWRGGQLQRT